MNSLSRRDFLKLVGGAAGMMALSPFSRVLPMAQFPESKRLGRLTATLDVMPAPRADFTPVKKLYPDTVLPWLREVTAQSQDIYVLNQRWVETPEGFIYSPYVQPVENRPNQPLTAIPAGMNGFWVEVTVPYVELALENPSPGSPSIKYLIENRFPLRLYYSQVMWVDQIKVSEVTGNIVYRISERYGSYGDVFWADGAAFHPISAEEVAPISPDVDPNEKRIVANLTYQTLSCFEGKREVYFCRMSSGMKIDAQGNQTDTWSTPVGNGQRTWRKMISVHMAGGTVDAGWDTPGVAWCNFFAGSGVAIHSTFWHNNYGTARSHGCLNVRPEDAKWIFRWSSPTVPIEPGDVTVGMPGGTQVDVVERSI
jgi:hypothetical protein